MKQLADQVDIVILFKGSYVGVMTENPRTGRGKVMEPGNSDLQVGQYVNFTRAQFVRNGQLR